MRNDSRFDDAEVEIAVEMGKGDTAEGRETMRGLLAVPLDPAGHGRMDTRRRAFGTLSVNVPREPSQPMIKPSHRNYSLNTHIPAEAMKTEQHTPNRLRKVNPSSPEAKPNLAETADSKKSSWKLHTIKATDGPTLPKGIPPPYSSISTARGSRTPLPVPKARRDEEVVAPAMPFGSALVESRVRKKGSAISLGRKKVHQSLEGDGSRIPAVNNTDRDEQAPRNAADGGPVVSKKKSMMRFTTVLGSKPKPADGSKISGLVRSSFGRRKKHDPEEPIDISFSTSNTPDGADESTVSAALPVRQSTESDFSIMSEWTIANISDASFGLPAHDESFHTESGEQYGGVPGRGGRSVRKKKSFAAAGVLLGKILHGPGARSGGGKEGGQEVSRRELMSFRHGAVEGLCSARW